MNILTQEAKKKQAIVESGSCQVFVGNFFENANRALIVEFKNFL